jgi:CRP-like cAMP-binding protein
MSLQISTAELHSTPLLRGLSAMEVEEFLGKCEKMYLSSWAKVFSGGEQSRALYIVLEGSVQILLEGVGDHPSVLAELGPGDVFGESNFFHPGPHHSTALCTSPVVLIQIQRTRYEELLASNSLLALRIGANAAEILAARLQTTDEWVQNFLAGHHREHAHDHWVAFRKGLAHGFTAKSGFMVGGTMNTVAD